MTIYTTETNFTTNNKPVVTSFNTTDSKGRELGYMVVTAEVDVVAKEDQESCGCTRPVGHYYLTRVQATKDGVKWGAVQPINYFTSEEERSDWINKRVADMKKKACK